MSFVQALLMGLIQGVTEFLPISSSGHLAIFKNIFHVNTQFGVFYDVMLHVGTLAAIFLALSKDIKRLLFEGIGIIRDLAVNAKLFVLNHYTNEDRRYRKLASGNYRKFVILLFVSTLPTAFMGVLLKDKIESLGTSLLPPAIGLLITGILLLVVDFFKAGNKTPKDITYWNALAIGICQGVALFPGISRAGMTIAACLLFGFSRKFAVKYSFVLAIPAVLGAALLQLKGFSGSGMTVPIFFTYLAGMIVAGAVGFVCIRFMLRLIQIRKFRFFAVYCFCIGVISIVCYFVL